MRKTRPMKNAYQSQIAGGISRLSAARRTVVVARPRLTLPRYPQLLAERESLLKQLQSIGRTLVDDPSPEHPATEILACVPPMVLMAPMIPITPVTKAILKTKQEYLDLVFKMSFIPTTGTRNKCLFQLAFLDYTWSKCQIL